MTDQADALCRLAGEQSRKPTRVITVTSGKGGVGKSSIALNMAIAMNRRGRRVLLFDTDFGFSNIDVMLGVRTRHNLMDVVKGNLDIREVIERGYEGVQFISGGSGVYELTQLDGSHLMRIVNTLKDLEDVADTIIFDTGAGVSDNMLRLICASHETLLVTTPEPTAVVDAYALIKIIGERRKSARLNLIVNKAGNPSEAAAVMDGLVRIAEKNVGVIVNKLGFVTRDPSMQRAIHMQVPILVSYPRCTASVNIGNLAASLIETPEIEHERYGIRGFFNRFFGKNYFYPG